MTDQNVWTAPVHVITLPTTLEKPRATVRLANLGVAWAYVASLEYRKD